jgi:CHRD domain
MKRVTTLFVAVLVLIAMIGTSPALAVEGLTAQLNGYEETPATLNTQATGVFLGLINDAQTEIPFTLFYTGTTGTVLFAHIHFGKPGESGGVAAFLCGGGGKPACLPPGEVNVGVVTAADVVAIAGQNLPAGDIAPLVRAIKSGFAYVNVHTSMFPGGEVRGQIKSASR